MKKMVTGKEQASYGLYFLGQNIFYMLIFMYMNTYYTDIGISAAAVAVIALIVKVWDAVNDPIFGGLMDKIKFKKGKFLPWLRISLVGIPVASVLMFAIPSGVSPVVKIIWAVVSYMLWDTAYTMCDVPIFGIVTAMTDVQQERVKLNTIGRMCAMAATLLVVIIIPVFRGMLGGWTSTVVMLAVVGAVTMLPICLTAKERCQPEVAQDADFSLKDMFKYLRSNKYLLVYWIAFLMSSCMNVGTTWGLYIARYCLGNEAIQSVTALIGVVPAIVLGGMVPVICKKVDKFKLYYGCMALSVVTNLISWFVGYESIPAYLVASVLCGVPLGFTAVLMFQFTPDCAEYGVYKSGISMPGITFAIQSFFNKMGSALATSFGAAMLVVLGFVEGEGAAQAEGFAQNLWTASKFMPIVGTVIALLILRAYKLNDHDVELMAKVNYGEMSREEAEAQMTRKY